MTCKLKLPLPENEICLHKGPFPRPYHNFGSVSKLKVIKMAALLDDLQVVPTTSGDETQRYWVPSHWKAQTDCVQTFVLLPTSEEWKRCKDLIAETLNSASIKKVTRVQNLWLWEAYTFNRKRMCERNSGQVYERLLFHGSGAINPYDIACSEDGFDVRHSKQGSWGRAIYFAEKA